MVILLALVPDCEHQRERGTRDFVERDVSGSPERGEEILITRRGRAVARLVPAESGFDRIRAQRAVDGILQTRRGVSLGGISTKELVNEGRP